MNKTTTKTKTANKKKIDEKSHNHDEHSHNHDGHSHDHSNHTHADHSHANDKKPSLIAKNSVIKLILPKEEVKTAYNKALKKLAKNLKLDGFRKGNVPAKIAEENLNPQQVIEETLQQVVPAIYTETIKKSGKMPITYPEFNPISLEKGKDWEIEAFFAERPNVDLKSYKEIVKKAQKQAVTDIKKQIEEMKKAAKKASKDGEDKKNEFREPSQEERKNFTLQLIYQELVSNIKPKIQELLVKEEVRYDLDNLSHRLQHMNIPFEKFLEQRKMTFEQLSGELAAGALGRLQMGFIISEIAQKEKITVEKADLDAEFSKIKDEKLKKQQQLDPRYADAMSQTILRQKVADYLLTIK